MADISGRVDILESQMLNVEQQILTYPTSSDFDALSVLISARFNTLNIQLADALAKLSDYEVYIVNLKLAHTSLERSLTGHTGLYLSGSSPAHHGL
jgi:hypothetical protein